MTKEQRANHLRQIAHLGGRATKQRYGTEYFRAIGKAGFQAYADNHFGGDRAAATNSLVGKGKVIGGKRWKGSVRLNPAQLTS